MLSLPLPFQPQALGGGIRDAATRKGDTEEHRAQPAVSTQQEVEYNWWRSWRRQHTAGKKRVKCVWEVQDPFMFLGEAQGVMGTDICAKEPIRDSDRHTLKGDINALARNHYANNTGQRRSCFMLPRSSSLGEACGMFKCLRWARADCPTARPQHPEDSQPSSHPRQGSPFVGAGCGPLIPLPVIS